MKKNIHSGLIAVPLIACLLIFVPGGCSAHSTTKDITVVETSASELTTAPLAAATQAETTLAEPVDVTMPEITTDLQIYNLQKLCKVWGYVKYTHSAFLLGQKDWDEELLKLMPEVALAEKEEDVNGILYDWYIGLGEIDYNNPNNIPEKIVIEKENILSQVDLSWLSDKAYLGESLSNGLAQIRVYQFVDRTNAPVSFNQLGASIFPNEKYYETMNYKDVKYRLLGLFRLWNAMEYYFPYMNILDDDWDEMLLVFIPEMLEGENKHSYELTLAALSAKLHDAHVGITGGDYLLTEFGRYVLPIKLTKAEGKLVVLEVGDAASPLMPGDVLVKLDGININDVIAQKMRYLSVTEKEKLLYTVGYALLLSQNEKRNITVIRDNEELTLTVQCYNLSSDIRGIRYKQKVSHERLENNIGLINPSKLEKGEIHEIMQEFADTDGLIVDLRQYPSDYIVKDLANYFLNKSKPAILFSNPSRAFPGMFVKDTVVVLGGQKGVSNSYFYENSVVILMDEMSMSQAEYTTMAVRNGPNVTVMGENSIGSDGEVTFLPLPGGLKLHFTGLGVYTPEGGQTQRIGLSPDIYIERTIAGVREGRDEYIEAAVQYIIDQNHKK